MKSEEQQREKEITRRTAGQEDYVDAPKPTTISC
jgi:hypothetical protein